MTNISERLSLMEDNKLIDVVKNYRQLRSLQRALNFSVIYIQYDGTETGEFEKNTADFENLDDLNVVSTAIRIDKYANDVFYKSELNSKLKELEISELFITGCVTDFCVQSTIQSTLTKDYSITVVEDGHTTGERPHLKAEKVIEHYNWVWQNMIPTNGKIKVQKTERIKTIFQTIQ